MPSATIDGAARTVLVDWYRRNRQRSRELFDLLDPSAYYTRPIALRNPIVFYEGHLPAFSVISLLRRGLGLPGPDARLEALFARGIDPEDLDSAVPRSGASTTWPTRREVLAFARRADEAIEAALARADLDTSGRSHAAMARGEAIYTALEHEAMHQETLLYMWRRLPHRLKRKPDGVQYETDAASPIQKSVPIPSGRATLGARRDALPFGWDNEFDELTIDVPAFELDAHSVTNAEYLEFIGDGGYARRDLWSDEAWTWLTTDGVRHPVFWTAADASRAAGEGRSTDDWFWVGMFENIPLPPSWPVYVSQAEAAAYARWKGRRLITEAEYHRAAFGEPGGGERALPWSEAPGVWDAPYSHFDFAGWEPVPAGSRPAGASAFGIHDLAGNGWEWTSSVFAPLPGFSAMPSYPEYSADFFDGRHIVLKGASPATARELVRRSFRNWFRPTYPYVYAKFRTARSL